MLFLGLRTGLGSALMVRGHIVPMELGALSYRKGAIEDYLGLWEKAATDGKARAPRRPVHRDTTEETGAQT
jgi:hypothetical protein